MIVDRAKEIVVIVGVALGIVFGIDTLIRKLLNPQGLIMTVTALFITYALFTLVWVVLPGKKTKVWSPVSLVILYVCTALFFFWVGTWMYLRVPSVPGNLVRQFDFQTSASGWKDISSWDANGKHIEGATVVSPRRWDRGVGYRLPARPGEWLHHKVRYELPVKADLIVVHLYVPDTPYIEKNSVGIRAWDTEGPFVLASSFTPIPPGQWTQIVLDLRGKYDLDDVALNSRWVSVEVLYSLKWSSQAGPEAIIVRLDDVAWYKSAGSSPSRGEQRGEDCTLFDFENETAEEWEVSSERVGIDERRLSSEQRYRGRWAMEFKTRLADGDTSTIATVWSGSPPRGACIAHVYLPSEVPVGTVVWGKFFVQSDSKWKPGPTQHLKQGGWNTLVWDTHDIDWDVGEEIKIGIQIGVEDGPYEGPIYIDDVQLLDK